MVRARRVSTAAPSPVAIRHLDRHDDAAVVDRPHFDARGGDAQPGHRPRGGGYRPLPARRRRGRPRVGEASRVWNRLKIKWWSWKFRRHCTSVGNRLTVLGPCAVHSAGDMTVGEGLTIRSRKFNMVEITCARDARLSFGNKVFLNQGVRIACTTEVTIGDNVLIGDETVILDSDYHGVAGTNTKSAPVRIESDVWLGTRVIVLRGVTIGEGSVVGAGSVVTRSLPPRTFAAGVPARVIRNLSEPS